MATNFLIVSTFIEIILTFLSANAINNPTKGSGLRGKETMNKLIRDAGCRNGGSLLAKGACIESDYDKESPPNSTHQMVNVTFWEYRISAINEKEKKVSFNLALFAVLP